MNLDLKGICASSGSACTSGSLDPSHVLLAIGLPHEIAHGSLRVSIGKYNTKEEIDYLIENLMEIVTRLREMSPLWEKIHDSVKVIYEKCRSDFNRPHFKEITKKFIEEDK